MPPRGGRKRERSDISVFLRIKRYDRKESLIHKVDHDTHLEATGIEGIMRKREVVVATEHALVDVGEKDKETGTRQLHVDIGIHEGIVATLNLFLIAESHCCGLVGRGMIAGIIVKVDTELHLKHPGHAEVEKEIGINGEFGKREHIFVGRGLIYNGVSPVESPPLEILLKLHAEYLKASSILGRKAIGAKVDVVLNVFGSHIYIGTCMGEIQDATETQTANLAEIVAPDEMV